MTRRRSNDIERAAEAHFLIRPVLVNALKSMIFTEDGLDYLRYKYNNQHDLWVGTYSDRFQDMTTMIRLGGAVESELRNFYMEKKSYKNLTELRADQEYKQGMFQRILPWQTAPGTAQHILQQAGFDLHAADCVRDAQEVMLHRHLYAHNIGLVDDKYIRQWKDLTGNDLSKNTVLSDYHDQDVYWFEPLRDLPTYIERLRKFVASLA